MTVTLMTMGPLRRRCPQAQTVLAVRIQSLSKTEDTGVYLLALSGQQPESRNARSLSPSFAYSSPSHLEHHKEGRWAQGWSRVAGMPGGERRRTRGLWGEQQKGRRPS